jgi:hypothetical protein
MNKVFIHTIQNLPKIFLKGWKQYYITENWYVHVLLFPWDNIKKSICLSFLYDGHQPHIFFYFLCQQNNMTKPKVEIDVTTKHYNNYNTHTPKKQGDICFAYECEKPRD